MSSTRTHLATWAIRVGEHQARPNDVEGGINVHGIGVLEGNDVHLVRGSKVSSHPFNTHVICNL